MDMQLIIDFADRLVIGFGVCPLGFILWLATMLQVYYVLKLACSASRVRLMVPSSCVLGAARSRVVL